MWSWNRFEVFLPPSMVHHFSASNACTSMQWHIRPLMVSFKALLMLVDRTSSLLKYCFFFTMNRLLLAIMIKLSMLIWGIEWHCHPPLYDPGLSETVGGHQVQWPCRKCFSASDMSRSVSLSLNAFPKICQFKYWNNWKQKIVKHGNQS